MQVTNCRAKAEMTDTNPPVGKDVLILTGSENTTVIKSLEIIAGTENAVVNIIRKDNRGIVYGKVKVDLEPQNYVMLWEGFVAIPPGHTLYLNADSLQVEAIANVVDL